MSRELALPLRLVWFSQKGSLLWSLAVRAAGGNTREGRFQYLHIEEILNHLTKKLRTSRWRWKTLCSSRRTATNLTFLVNNLRINPMTQFSIPWILSLNRLSQKWGQVQSGTEQPAGGYVRVATSFPPVL
jgi:hypothetical protein